MTLREAAKKAAPVTCSVTAALLVSLVLAGCSGANPEREAAEREPRNPVEVLRAIDGCTVPDGVTAGEQDIRGNRYASCEKQTFWETKRSSGTEWQEGHTLEIEVRTYPGTPKDNGWVPAVSDSTVQVVGSDFVVSVRGDATAMEKVDVAAIAEATGGELPQGYVQPTKKATEKATEKPTPTPTPTAPAQTTPDCVTEDEFAAVSTGDSKAEVITTFGMDALVHAEGDDQTYMSCDRQHAAIISYAVGKVSGKQWVMAG